MTVPPVADLQPSSSSWAPTQADNRAAGVQAGTLMMLVLYSNSVVIIGVRSNYIFDYRIKQGILWRVAQLYSPVIPCNDLH